MAIAINWGQVLTVENDFYEPGSAGTILLTSGALIAGMHHNTSVPAVQEFYESLNNGRTWTKISELPAPGISYSRRMLHWPTDICVFATPDPDSMQLDVYRSTDGAHHWTKVYTVEPGNPDPSNIYATGATSYGHTSGAIVGSLQIAADNTRMTEIIYTTDKGATWTNGGLITPGTGNNVVRGIRARSGDNFVICTAPDNLYMQHPLLTTTSTPSLSKPNGGDLIEIFDAAWLTESIGLAAGYINKSLPSAWPALYRSTNAGSTWQHIDAANVQGWPNTIGLDPSIRAIHRLTKASALACLIFTGHDDPGPFQLSLDAGQTWSKANGGIDSFGDGGVGSQGQICTAPDGTQIACLEISASGRTNVELWRGTWSF